MDLLQGPCLIWAPTKKSALGLIRWIGEMYRNNCLQNLKSSSQWYKIQQLLLSLEEIFKITAALKLLLILQIVVTVYCLPSGLCLFYYLSRAITAFGWHRSPWALSRQASTFLPVLPRRQSPWLFTLDYFSGFFFQRAITKHYVFSSCWGIVL